MSRTTPIIAPEALRDHADEARIDRVWERLERNLPVELPQQSLARRSARPLAAAVAAAACFVCGFGVARWVYDEQSAGVQAQLRPASDEPSRTRVYAAGTTTMRYTLPGGGTITVQPGSIVDTIASHNDRLTLRLVRGEASLNTVTNGPGRDTHLLVLVGYARVSAMGADLRIRHAGQTAELHVVQGIAEVSSPDADEGMGMRHSRVGPNGRLSVPIRVLTARFTPPVAPSHKAPTAPSAQPEDKPPEPAVGWRERCAQADFSGALKLLRSQAGGAGSAIGAARSARDLMCISDANLWSKGGNQAVAIQALKAVVEKFPNDPRTPAAALTLGKMYGRANKYDEAQKYLRRARSLSPQGVVAEDALCKLMHAEARVGHTDAVTRLAQEYRTQHPDGPCNEEIDRLIADAEARRQQLQAQQADAGVPDAAAASDAAPVAAEKPGENAADAG